MFDELVAPLSSFFLSTLFSFIPRYAPVNSSMAFVVSRKLCTFSQRVVARFLPIALFRTTFETHYYYLNYYYLRNKQRDNATDTFFGKVHCAGTCVVGIGSIELRNDHCLAMRPCACSDDLGYRLDRSSHMKLMLHKYQHFAARLAMEDCRRVRLKLLAQS